MNRFRDHQVTCGRCQRADDGDTLALYRVCPVGMGRLADAARAIYDASPASPEPQAEAPHGAAADRGDR